MLCPRPILTLALLVVIGLSACGKAGRPLPPEGSTYPLVYPNASFTKGGATAVSAQPADPRQGFSAAGHVIDPSVRAPQSSSNVVPQIALPPNTSPFYGSLNAPMPEDVQTPESNQ